MSEPTLLRTVEVSKRLGFPVRTILKWAQDGKLPSILTPGGDRRYRADDVQAAYDAMYGGDGPPLG